jgi:DNA repair protein RadC
MVPLERYLLHGPDQLGEADLVALALGARAEVAGRLLDRFAHPRAAALAPPRALVAVPGITPARAVRLHAGLTLGLRAAQVTPGTSSPVRSPEDAAAWLGPALATADHEEVHALYLDAAFRPRALQRLSRGTSTFSAVDSRQVFGPALALAAHGVILAHNHPSGVLEPSASDRALTDHLERAARTLGIHFVDHLIVASSGWRSIPMNTSYAW